MSARLRYPELAPEGIAALRGFEHYLNTGTALPAILLELIRLRVSQMNGCDFCRELHTAELRKHNEATSRIDAVATWQQSDAFTGRERAALAWAEALTNVQQSQASDADYTAVQAFFHEKELVDLTLAIGSINLWNRLGVAFRPGWNPEAHAKAQVEAAQPADSNAGEDERSAIGDDGGKVAED